MPNIHKQHDAALENLEARVEFLLKSSFAIAKTLGDDDASKLLVSIVTGQDENGAPVDSGIAVPSSVNKVFDSTDAIAQPGGQVP